MSQLSPDSKSLRVLIWDLKADEGPVGIEMWSIDARDALKRDPERFVVKLPKGMKPGPAHERNQERAARARDELAAAAAKDPVFGGVAT